MKYNKKTGQYDKEGAPKLRVFHRKANGLNSARFLVKCGDCENSLEIFYGDDNFLEIDGIVSSRKEWRKLLLPLLKEKMKKNSKTTG